ncbi:S8 family serine peptidase [Micromonospora sp. NPDC049366]|uniref:S8 family serine peptidase n=1 Tax=Micromonospora sp. NPDC049366 TaxID=3364271 RepID=UPI0037B34185
MTGRGTFTRQRAVVAGLVAAVLTVLVTPGTALAERGWELSALSVTAAHKISKGKGVTVAVIDTGIRTKHPVLAGRATEGPDMLDETDQSESWYGRHGTSMASSILDVAPAAKVLGLRAIRDDEDPDFVGWSDTEAGNKIGDRQAIAKAIRYAADHGAKVISMSIGDGKDPMSRPLREEAAAIEYALSKGVVVVSAAGNEGRVDDENGVSYPGAYPGVITAGAAEPGNSSDCRGCRLGARAKFSQVHSYVDFLAPGVAIYSANFTSSGRKKTQGTSSAGAITAGVAALIVAKYPDLAPRQVEQALIRSASHYAKGHDPQTGYGLINAEKALKVAASLKPESALPAVGREGAGSHFGPGDDGTPRIIGQPLDTTYLVVGGVGGLLGLAVIVVGLVLFGSGRRAARAVPTAPAPATSAPAVAPPTPSGAPDPWRGDGR